MYENVFRRVEEKYLLDKKKLNELFNRINKYIKHDKFYISTISNIYFDNKNSDLIVNSLDKPIYKEKIRLRSYTNKPTLDSEVFFEKKDKYKGIVGKRRIKMTLSDFYNYIDNHEYDDNNQIMKELDYFIKYYDLVPSIYIAYDRKSYVGKYDNNLRITIDTNLRSRNDNLNLEYGDINTKYYNNDYFIMEIKTLGSMPLWLVRVLSELNIYPTSFSKYGKIYENNLNNKEVVYVR